MSLLQIFSRATQQFIDQRKSKRHRVQRPAMIDLGRNLGRDAGLRSCIVCDMSEDGARIAVESPETVPKEFWLMVSQDETASRRCRVIWRSADQIGVSYLLPPLQQPLD